ncbi:hypothetical protein DA391_03865 [Yersinia massiliensis]|uniref:Uncharacterized protein n=1 Tax=Yersinia massiliensis TaxID=419257 RepID=A0ABM6UPS5_9GAMM|nr:hypothetical protein DA391_03865 [Yersinia massiliensis]
MTINFAILVDLELITMNNDRDISVFIHLIFVLILLRLIGVTFECFYIDGIMLAIYIMFSLSSI